MQCMDIQLVPSPAATVTKWHYSLTENMPGLLHTRPVVKLELAQRPVNAAHSWAHHTPSLMATAPAAQPGRRGGGV